MTLVAFEAHPLISAAKVLATVIVLKRVLPSAVVVFMSSAVLSGLTKLVPSSVAALVRTTLTAAAFLFAIELTVSTIALALPVTRRITALTLRVALVLEGIVVIAA
jgi:hypothetical protein